MKERYPTKLKYILTLGLLGGLATAAYEGIQYSREKDLIPNPNPAHNPIPTDLARQLSEATQTSPTDSLVPTSTLESTIEPTIILTPEVTKEMGYLFGEKVDFFDFQKAINGLMKINGGPELAISSFKPLEYLPTTDLSEFAPGKGVGLTWKNFRQYGGINVVDYFLYLHSGRMKNGDPLQMTDIQGWLDMDPVTGYRRNFQIPDQILKDNVIGSKIIFGQAENGSASGTIEAAIRIAPLEVDGLYVSLNPDKPWKKSWRPDLLEYLAQKYPGYGFENVLDKDRALVLITCGNNLNGGETPASGREDYEQSRYIFVTIAQ